MQENDLVAWVKSNTLRVHRALRAAGVEAQLEVYEGQSHAQYLFDDRLPETAVAFGEIAEFFDKHLGGGVTIHGHSGSRPSGWPTSSPKSTRTALPRWPVPRLPQNDRYCRRRQYQ